MCLLSNWGHTVVQEKAIRMKIQTSVTLYPILPKSKHICFYPMSKSRRDGDNWYTLSMEKRKELMYRHGMIGRSYAGKIQQIIGGSTGFDDWEWGVTLFANDFSSSRKSSMKCALTKSARNTANSVSSSSGIVWSQPISKHISHFNLLNHVS